MQIGVQGIDFSGTWQYDQPIINIDFSIIDGESPDQKQKNIYQVSILMEEQLFSLRVGHQRILDHLLLGVAPFFQQENSMKQSCMEPVCMDTWDCICDALLEKEIQGAFLPIPMAIDLFDAGIDISLLMFVHTSGSLFLRSKFCNTIHSLEDKILLMASEFGVDNMLLHRFLATANFCFENNAQYAEPQEMQQDSLPSGRVFREIVPHGIMNEMIERDEDQDIAGCILCEPFASQCMENGKTKLLCTSDELWQNHPCCGFVVYKDILDSYPAEVENILSLFYDSALGLHEIQEESISCPVVNAAADFLGREPEEVKKIIFGSKIHFHPEQLIPQKAPIDLMVDYMSKQMGLLPKNTNIDGFIDAGPLIRVLEGLGWNRE